MHGWVNNKYLLLSLAIMIHLTKLHTQLLNKYHQVLCILKTEGWKALHSVGGRRMYLVKQQHHYNQ